MSQTRRKDTQGRKGVDQDRNNVLTSRCARCQYAFRPEELVYRNGILVCTVPGDYKQFPCDDQDSISEAVSREPYTTTTGNAEGLADLELTQAQLDAGSGADGN